MSLIDDDSLGFGPTRLLYFGFHRFQGLGVFVVHLGLNRKEVETESPSDEIERSMGLVRMI